LFITYNVVRYRRKLKEQKVNIEWGLKTRVYIHEIDHVLKAMPVSNPCHNNKLLESTYINYNIIKLFGHIMFNSNIYK
jgi:hypothetical protein